MAPSTEIRSTARINPYTAILSTVSSEHLRNGAINRKSKYCENKPVHRHFVHHDSQNIYSPNLFSDSLLYSKLLWVAGVTT